MKKRVKFIFITGGVISGLGKGIINSSISLLLKENGFKVSPIKADPYLNVDAGTMNPIIHGETFVTEDGLETDQDIGHYERFLNENLSKLNYMTSGQVFLSVIQKERELKYNGECVEFTRHIPEEIINRLEKLADKSDADIITFEIGGTIGDMQNILFLEAARQLKFKYPDDIITIHVGYLPLPKNLGELKTKPIQQSVYSLLSTGVQPDIIVTRSEKEIDALRKRKISIFCNVRENSIFSSPDLDSVYQVPDYLKKQGITEKIMELLSIKPKRKDTALEKSWTSFSLKTKSNKKLGPKVGIIGKYFKSGEYSLQDSYVCVIEALKHAYFNMGFVPNFKWINSDDVEKKGVSVLKEFKGLIVPQGWGSRGVEGKIKTASFARKNKIPYLGLCFGMQLAAVSFARDVLGMQDANSTEINPKTKNPVIHIMENQVQYLQKKQYGGTIRLGAWPAKIKKDTILYGLYQRYQNNQYSLPIIQERHRHRYEFNNRYKEVFEKNGVVFSGMSPDGKLIEAFELKNHPFYIAVQYHPEFKSRPLSPHPIFLGFLNSCLTANV